MKSLRLYLLILGCYKYLWLILKKALVKWSFYFVDGTFQTSQQLKMIIFAISAGYRLAENGDEYGWMGNFRLEGM